MEGKNPIVRDRVAKPETGFLKAFLCLYFPLVPYFLFIPRKSFFMMPRIIWGIPQMLIWLPVVVCLLKYGEYAFSCLRLMTFLNRADCICVIVRAEQQPVFGHHLNEGSFCLGCWRNPSVLCSLPHIPCRQRTCCCEGTFLHWTRISWGSPCCQAPSSSDKGRDTALLTFNYQSDEKQKGHSPWRTVESLWNVSFPCCLLPLSFQWPWTSFWLLATFPAQQKIGCLPNLD